jgi:hypothetical protein
MTEANRCRALLINANQLTSFYIAALLKNRSNVTGDFKNLKSVDVPKFGPNPSFKVIIKKLFS